ncbi:hypothetical protein J132_05789 [Termitomyces sp. J132]|nr:hypothetical protein J132_05789 [Termitomyces sp. J132]
MKFALALAALLALASASPLEDRQSLAAGTCANPANARPFYRLYNRAVVDHFYTLSASEAQSATNLGYRREGISSYIFPTSQRGTVPLYRLYSPSANDHFYTTSAAERNSAIGLGYNSEGVAGYIYPNANCGGVPFYRLYSPSGRDHFYTTSAAERDSACNPMYHYPFVLEASLVALGLNFFHGHQRHPCIVHESIQQTMKFALALTALLTVVSAAPLSDLQAPLAPDACSNLAIAFPFYRLYNSATLDHFYTLNANEAQSATNLGYSREGTSSHIFLHQQFGTVPLYRLYSPGVNDHFYTTSAAERNSAIGLGYNSEGVAGYIYPNANCGGVPFYRLYSPSGRDHFYTTSAAERDSACNPMYHYPFVLEASLVALGLNFFHGHQRHPCIVHESIQQTMKFALALTALLTVVSAAPLSDLQAPLAPDACSNLAIAFPFYRLYNSATLDHFYTLNANEAQSATNLGYSREGTSSHIFLHQQFGTVPLYRLYSPGVNDHFYTTSAAERDSAVGLGYNSEGVAGLYSASARDHFYTTSAAERDSAVRLGYASEGVAGYVYP